MDSLNGGIGYTIDRQETRLAGDEPSEMGGGMRRIRGTVMQITRRSFLQEFAGKRRIVDCSDTEIQTASALMGRSIDSSLQKYMSMMCLCSSIASYDKKQVHPSQSTPFQSSIDSFTHPSFINPHLHPVLSPSRYPHLHFPQEHY